MLNFDVNTRFRDRKDAGEQLARLLDDYKDKGVLVLGIPRGGLEVAYYVSLYLHARLSVIVSKKLSYPGHEEYGFGAISEEDFFYVSPGEGTLLSGDELLEIIAHQRTEIQRRVMLYRKGSSLPSMKNQVVIIVDDGIATGVTLVPAIRLCRKKEAARIIIAAPVSGKNYDRHLLEADEIKVAYQPPLFYGVGQAYERFPQLADETVIELLEEAEKKKIV